MDLSPFSGIRGQRVKIELDANGSQWKPMEAGCWVSQLRIAVDPYHSSFWDYPFHKALQVTFCLTVGGGHVELIDILCKELTRLKRQTLLGSVQNIVGNPYKMKCSFLAEICLYLSESIPWIILASLKYWQGWKSYRRKKPSRIENLRSWKYL